MGSTRAPFQKLPYVQGISISPSLLVLISPLLRPPACSFLVSPASGLLSSHRFLPTAFSPPRTLRVPMFTITNYYTCSLSFSVLFDHFSNFAIYPCWFVGVSQVLVFVWDVFVAASFPFSKACFHPVKTHCTRRHSTVFPPVAHESFYSCGWLRNAHHILHDVGNRFILILFNPESLSSERCNESLRW